VGVPKKESKHTGKFEGRRDGRSSVSIRKTVQIVLAMLLRNLPQVAHLAAVDGGPQRWTYSTPKVKASVRYWHYDTYKQREWCSYICRRSML